MTTNRRRGPPRKWSGQDARRWKCFSHAGRFAIAVRWFNRSKTTGGPGLHVRLGVCAVCLNYLRDGKQHRRPADNTYWRMMEPGFRPPQASGREVPEQLKNLPPPSRTPETRRSRDGINRCAVCRGQDVCTCAKGKFNRGRGY